MSLNTQTTHMKNLTRLMSMDLSYIHGSREDGPNGAKKEFLDKGKTFLRALAKDMTFAESRIVACPGGIGVPGEVLLYGMWSEGNGIFVMLSPPCFLDACVLYRTIDAIKGGHSGINQYIGLHRFSRCDYNAFCEELRRQDKRGHGNGSRTAA